MVQETGKRAKSWYSSKTKEIVNINQLRPSARAELAVVGFACLGGCGEGTERVNELSGGFVGRAIGVTIPSQIFLVVFSCRLFLDF